MFKQQKLLSMFMIGLMLLGSLGCHTELSDENTETAAVPISVMTLTASPFIQTANYQGRVKALRSADIRPQISGIVQQRLFEQGSEIKAGTVLFQINSAVFQAEVESATASLQRAEAVLRRAQLEAQRLTALTRTGVISRQLADDAISLRDQALADVAQAKATLSRRMLDVQFASIQAPISGHIDQALVTEGALVAPTDSTPMARIHHIDQVYVDVRLPASAMALLREKPQSAEAGLAVDILDGDGKPLGMQGRLLFAGIEVDAGSGDVLLRVQVDNPEHRLLPGLYVQVQIPQIDDPSALKVPQQAVTRVAGQSMVWLLNSQGQVEQVVVELGALVDQHYQVLSGLSAGQQIVIEGIERLTPSTAVVARPWPLLARQQPSTQLQ